MKTYDVAVVGATGLVGQTILRLLEKRAFPVGRLHPFGSGRTPGGRVAFGGRDHAVLDEAAIGEARYDLAFFAAGAAVSVRLAGRFVAQGALVIDKTEAFRLDPEVPLVVPEVNGAEVVRHRGIIANPNCSTIQLVMALAPMRRLAKLVRVEAVTFQSVSGAGKEGVEELNAQTRAAVAGTPPPPPSKFAHPIFDNCIPQIDAFGPDGFTGEERKMILETRKILGEPIPVTATCVRVPVTACHAESVTVEFDAEVSRDALVAALAAFPGVRVLDEPAANLYPLQAALAGTDEVAVGRLRRDPTRPCGYHFWCVADNIVKGAALNGIQIAEEWIRRSGGRRSR